MVMGADQNPLIIQLTELKIKKRKSQLIAM